MKLFFAKHFLFEGGIQGIHHRSAVEGSPKTLIHHCPKSSDPVFPLSPQDAPELTVRTILFLFCPSGIWKLSSGQPGHRQLIAICAAVKFKYARSRSTEILVKPGTELCAYYLVLSSCKSCLIYALRSTPLI